MSDLVKQIESELIFQHWDGTGCGTNGPNACANCFGPSPMSAREVAEIAVEVMLS